MAGLLLKWYTKYYADLTTRAHNAAFIIVGVTALSTANNLPAIINVSDYGSISALVIACILAGWGAGDGAFNLAGGNDAVPQPKSAIPTPQQIPEGVSSETQQSKAA